MNLDNSIFKTQLFRYIDEMINEFELSFDYVDKSNLKKLKEKVKLAKKDNAEFKKIIEKLNSDLEVCSGEMYYIINTNKKLKKREFYFLNDIILLDILHFDIFKNENKNTLRVIVDYLYNIYSCCMLLNVNPDNQDVETLNEMLASFSEKFSKLERYKKQAEEEKQNNKNRKVSRSVKIQKNNILDGLGNLEGMFGNLLNNKELMNIASEITDDLKNKKINPVELLSGMMTGKPSGEMKNLMDDITNKLEYKIESGQLNKEELEKEANNVIENIKNSDVESKIPMLKSMFKNTDLNNN